MQFAQTSRAYVRWWTLFLTLASALGAGGCAARPDLVVKDVSVQWTATAKSASATIANQGSVEAGPTTVYFNPEECPNSFNRRPQLHFDLPALAAGAEVTLTGDFPPLAHADNQNLGRVYSVAVIADPKDAVDESNERNNWNSSATGYDVTGLTVHTYDEALATILRGLKLDDAAAGELEISPGYYKISTHRVSGAPNEKAIALHIFKNYFESVVPGASSPPRRDEAFVFSIIDDYSYTSAGYRFSGRDFHGHTLTFDISFLADCFQVNSVTLNCTVPWLTVESYTTGELRTCGVTSEPPWTDPQAQ